MKLARLRSKFGGNKEQLVYMWLGAGIVYSFLFWTLLNSIFCIAFVAYWLIISEKEFDIKTTRSRLMLLFIALYLISVTGLLYTSNFKQGLASLQQRLPILIFPLIFGTTRVMTTTIVHKILDHLVAGVAIVCSICLVYCVYHFSQTGKLLTGPDIIIVHGHYPYVLGLSCVLSFVALFNRGDKKKSFTGMQFTVMAILGIFILLLNVRMITLLLISVILYHAFTSLTSWQSRLASFVIIMTLIISIYNIPSVKNRWKEMGDFSGNSTISLDKDSSLYRGWGGKAVRVAVWKCAMDVVAVHWPAGVGTGDVQDTLQAAYEKRQFYFASRFNRYNAHNEYLQTLIGHGVLGLLILLAVIIAPIALYKSNMIPVIYVQFILLFAVICCSEVILNINKGAVWYAFFNSLLAFSVKNSNK